MVIKQIIPATGWTAAWACGESMAEDTGVDHVVGWALTEDDDVVPMFWDCEVSIGLPQDKGDKGVFYVLVPPGGSTTEGRASAVANWRRNHR